MQEHLRLVAAATSGTKGAAGAGTSKAGKKGPAVVAPVPADEEWSSGEEEEESSMVVDK